MSTAEKASGFWKQALLLVLLLSFTVLIAGGVSIYRNTAPVPERVTTADGQSLTDSESIMGGQAVYQKYGLMNYGSVLGHGSYYGQDFTAEALHVAVQAVKDFKAREEFGLDYSELEPGLKGFIDELVTSEIKVNRYDPQTKTLILTDAQAYALRAVREHYRDLFENGLPERGLPPGMISESHMPAADRAYVGDGDQLDQISDFFFWTAWLSSTNRYGLDYTYTNNWPYDEEAGNIASFNAVAWSAVSVALLVLFLGLILYFYFRYNLRMEEAYTQFPRLDLDAMEVTPSQQKLGKFILIVMLLFLVQTLLGGLLSHYYIEGDSFYGLFDPNNLLPFNVARTWHLQLAIFWIATAWLTMGLYVSPVIGGREPKGQGLLVDLLFWALVIVVGGSLTGEWLGVKGYLGNLWYYLGTQGWEYLELGRVWQVLLVIGLALWLFNVVRGMAAGLRREQDRGGLTHLLLYSAVAIPLFYVFAFFFSPSTNITYADYWRWWVIHLWVEGVFEVFAVVVIGFLMVQMGLVTKRSTLRALYFQFIILLGSGIIGTGHHYYFIGAPSFWIALGAVFSALEVIPLTLLIVEAHAQYKVIQKGGIDFPYRHSFKFLVATGFWNLVGAGVLGFLINLPIVNYFEHGSFLTATHGHGALMGVYGMFAIALAMYTLRNIVKPSAWSERLLNTSFWGLNVGLAGMLAMTLLPVGFLQMAESYRVGFWAARSFEFYQTPVVQNLLWLRIVPDTVFIVAGVVPLVVFAFKAIFNLRPVTTVKEDPSLKAGLPM